MLNLWHSWQRGDHICDLRAHKALALEEVARVGAEQIQMASAAGMRRLARGSEQRSAGSTLAHQRLYVKRANQRRVDLCLDADYTNRLVAIEGEYITRRGPLDSFSHHPGARE